MNTVYITCQIWFSNSDDTSQNISSKTPDLTGGVVLSQSDMGLCTVHPNHLVILVFLHFQTVSSDSISV